MNPISTLESIHILLPRRLEAKWRSFTLVSLDITRQFIQAQKPHRQSATKPSPRIYGCRSARREPQCSSWKVWDARWRIRCAVLHWMTCMVGDGIQIGNKQVDILVVHRDFVTAAVTVHQLASCIVTAQSTRNSRAICSGVGTLKASIPTTSYL